jgi:hypothetical protein
MFVFFRQKCPENIFPGASMAVVLNLLVEEQLTSKKFGDIPKTMTILQHTGLTVFFNFDKEISYTKKIAEHRFRTTRYSSKV